MLSLSPPSMLPPSTILTFRGYYKPVLLNSASEYIELDTNNRMIDFRFTLRQFPVKKKKNKNNNNNNVSIKFNDINRIVYYGISP